MNTPAHPAGLLGRGHELAAIDALLDALPDRSGGLVLVGEPGIGKSSLLHAARLRARALGYRVLETVGTEAEAAYPFAALHQLLRPLLRGSTPDGPELGRAQHEALMTAFGALDGPAPAPDTVAVSASNLLRLAAVRRPVVVLVDDLQWVDRPTHDALGVVVRRLGEHGIALLSAARTGHDGPVTAAGVPVLPVGGLDDASARDLLTARGGDLGPTARSRILAQAAGNPLALVELPLVWNARVADAAGSGAVPVSTRLERSFSGRRAALTAPARDLLLVMALTPETDEQQILSAATALAGTPICAAAVRETVTAGLVVAVGGHLRFRHPLVRSGVVAVEDVGRRQAAHAALAATSADLYRRTWHRAMAIVGPDDHVADELEAVARISHSRGAPSSAMAQLERAAQLTSASALRGHRLLLAAQHAFGLGEPDTVARLVAQARTHSLSDADWARLEWLREIFHDGVPGDAARVAELCATAQRAATAGDRGLALDLLLGAALRCWWADTGPAARAQVVSTTRAVGGTGGDPRYVAACAVAEPVLAAADVGIQLADPALTDTDDPDALRILGMAAHAVGDTVRARSLLGRAEGRLRDEGRVGLLSHVLGISVVLHLELGHFAAAYAAQEEASRLATETNQPVWTTGTLATGARTAALHGDVDTALTLAGEATRAAGRNNDHLCCAQLAVGTAHAVAGRPVEAYDALRRMLDPTDPAYHWREGYTGITLLAETARPAGQLDDARRLLERLEEIQCRTPCPMLHVHLLHARAVLADDAVAEPLYLAGLADPHLRTWRLTRAHLELAYGSWLLGHERDLEAADVLRTARDDFTKIGATPWVHRAEAGLADHSVRSRPTTGRVGDIAVEGHAAEPGERRVLDDECR